MLEELVENERNPPAETATAMLSFLQNELPAGGSATEKRFLMLFEPLCTRIFGKILDAKEDYRHKEGGWLSAQTPWTRQTAATVAAMSPRQKQQHQIQSSARRHLAISPQNRLPDPVVTLLGPARKPTPAPVDQLPSTSLVEAIIKECENRPTLHYRFPFHGLPKSTQKAILAILASVKGQQLDRVQFTQNQYRLVAELLHFSPNKQTDIARYSQMTAIKKNKPGPGIHLSPVGFSSPLSPRQSSPLKDKAEENVPPQLGLSMLEYYLFLFVRFPLAAPKPKQTMTRSVSSRREPYGKTVYYDVFERTMRHFLPYEQSNHTNSTGFPARHSELFLRIIIALWIELQTQIEPTNKVLQLIHDRNVRAGIVNQAPSALNLDASFDLVHAKFDPPYSMVQNCLRKLMSHVICDPALKESVTQGMLEHRNSSWCLGAAMTALQQPFYNQVRTAFRHASIHSNGSPFYTTFTNWLIWLEPWNVGPKRDFTPRAAIMHSSTGGRTTSLTIPAHNAKSKYAAAWEPYVAANLFLYLQPLAIFLRRSRELDFSAGKCDNSIKLVQRAFRVFTPELVATLSRLLQGQSNWNHLIERHREILGVYAPPPGPMTMQSLQSDMQSLLEEIHMQHVKKLRELDPVSRAFHKLEHWFGHGVLSGQEKALERLLANARIITQLPLEYNVSLSASERSRSASATFDGVGAPQRTATGELSDTGREQLLRGQVKCNPADIPFRGDKMRMRVMTYEVGVLVTLAIRLSDWLNKKFDIDPNDKSRMFRFNLRFLANYRNLFYIAVFVYILSYGLA